MGTAARKNAASAPVKATAPRRMKAAGADWADRALAVVTPEGLAAVAHLGELMAAAPVKAAPEYPPLDISKAPIIRVGAETISVKTPSATWEANGDRARISEDWGNRENDQAALRHYLDQPFDWGRGTDGSDELRVAVLLQVDGKLLTVVLEGTEAAIKRALPDKATLAAWQAAGAADFPLWNFDPEAGPIGSVCWVPIADVPARLQVLQMEHAGRQALEG